MSADSAAPWPVLPVRVRVHRVPKEGFLYVRVLGTHADNGILVHPKGSGKKPELLACAGPSCPAALHQGKTTWRSYCAVLVWDEGPRRAWLPGVLEITEHLDEVFGQEFKRGQYWKLFREVGSHGHQECTGILLDTEDPTELRTAFDVKPVVQRMLGNAAVKWGQRNPASATLYLMAEQKPGPAELDQVPEGQRPLEPSKVRELLRNAGLLPGPSKNGRH